MNKQTVEQVVYMLQLVHSADTPESRRKEAQEFCQRLKESPDAIHHGVELASSAGSGLAPQVQHFGLQLIEHAVRHHWRQNNKAATAAVGKIGTDEMLQLRDQMWRMIFDACRQQQTAAYIKEKLVEVMVQLIIRLWPSAQWCNLSTQLMQLYSSEESSSVHREMALRIWRTLGEEMFVFDRDAMATVRKSDLVNGIIGALLPKAVVVELYPSGYRMSGDIDDLGNGKKALPIVLEPGNEDGWLLRWAAGTADSASMDEHVLVGLVDTIGVFMDWMPIKALAPTQVVPRLASLLQTSSSDAVRLRAAAALEVISRRIADLSEERDMVVLEFAQNYDGAVAVALGDAYRSTLAPTVDEAWVDSVDALALAKSVSQISSNLATLQWARKKLEINVLPHPERLLELLMVLCKDQRYTVASVALGGWAAIIKHGTLSRAPAVAATFSTLTEHATAALFGVCRAAHLLAEAISKGGTASASAGIDEDEADQFESLAELRTFLTSELRTRLLAIVRGMCDLDPAGFVGWILPSLVPVFAAQQQQQQQQGSSIDIGHVSVIEAAFMTVDAILSTLDDAEQRALADSEDEAVAAIRKARAPCYELGRRVVQFEAASTQLTTKQLNTLPSFAFLLRRPAVESSEEARELLFMVLQKCTGYLGASSSSSQSTNGSNSRESRNVARRATAAMVRLAVAIPDSLMLIYQDLSQLVQNRMADPDVADTVKSYLGEFQLALVAGATVGLAERKELARPIIRPLIESLNEFAPALQSPETFMSMLLALPTLDQAYAHSGGDAFPAGAKQTLDSARGARNRLTYVISALHIYLNRTLSGSSSPDSQQLAPLWSDYVGELVPLLMRLIQCVQSLWNPAHWQHLPWQSAQAQRNLFGLLEISNAERLMIVGVNSSDNNQQDDNQQQQQQPNGTKEQRLDLETRAIYHSLAVFREYAYKCLGKCARLPEMFDPQAVPDPAALFTSCLFADAESMSARHWRMLLTDVIRPVLEAVGNWPGLNTTTTHASSSQSRNTSMVAAFVPAWLSPLFSFCTQRLQTEWRDLLARGAVLTSKEDITAVALGKYIHHADAGDRGSSISVDDDIVQEKMLRDWTRSWSLLVSDLLADIAEWIPEATQIEHELLSSSQVSATTSGTSERNRAVGAFLLNSSDVFATTVNTALGALQYKDTQSVQRVLSSLSRIASPLVVVALLPMYVPPTQQHAAIVTAYLARIDNSLVKSPSSSSSSSSSGQDCCSSVFTWLATDLVSVLVGVLRDSALIDLQASALGLLADLVYFSAAISSRMPRSWMFRNSSGSAGDDVSPDAGSIVPVGDPGLVFRRAMHGTMLPALEASGITSDEYEHAAAQLASAACDAKHRKAIMKVVLQPMLAVEKSQLFGDKAK